MPMTNHHPNLNKTPATANAATSTHVDFHRCLAVQETGRELVESQSRDSHP